MCRRRFRLFPALVMMFALYLFGTHCSGSDEAAPAPTTFYVGYVGF